MMGSGTNGTSLIHLKVFALNTGQLSHPDRWLFEDGDNDLVRARHPYPNYSFLIQHPRGKSILFDLGLKKNFEEMPPLIKKAYPTIEPVVLKDADEILLEGHVAPSDISAVIFSHLHFDHVGDPTKFPDAEMIAGPGSRAASFPGWPAAPGSPFLSAPIEHPKYHELSFVTDTWVPFGPFPRAHDYFGDGSLFLIDTPGHMAGHLGAMALTGQDEWIFMGGDCCHHRSLLVGSRPMSVTVGPAGTPCFHKDPRIALQTIDKIRSVAEKGDVLVALSHDAYLKDTMPEYPQSLDGWKSSQWKKDLNDILARAYGL